MLEFTIIINDILVKISKASRFVVCYLGVQTIILITQPKKSVLRFPFLSKLIKILNKKGLKVLKSLCNFKNLPKKN